MQYTRSSLSLPPVTKYIPPSKGGGEEGGDRGTRGRGQRRDTQFQRKGAADQG